MEPLNGHAAGRQTDLAIALRGGGCLPAYSNPSDNPVKDGNGVPNKKRTPGKQGNSKQGRFKLLNDFVDNPDRKISPTAMAVWMVLYRHGQADGTAQVAISVIAKQTSTSERTVIRAMKKLKEQGFIEVVMQGSSYQKRATKYRLFGKAKSS